MRFERVRELTGHLPFISADNARFLYDLILEECPAQILELGIAHGTTTCLMAAALDDLGSGHLTAVDLIEARDLFDPSAEELLATTGLANLVTIHRMQTGYNWFLHDMIRDRTEDDHCTPVYDLCIIDGPKNWTIDGAAFFMVDKLLRPDGIVIFDDYNWTYEKADSRRDATDGITHRRLSDAERRTPHIREVFELLVKQHPSYGELAVMPAHNWAMARKSRRRSKRYAVISENERTASHGLVARTWSRFRRLLS